MILGCSKEVVALLQVLGSNLNYHDFLGMFPSAQSTQDFNATHFTNLAQQFSSQFPLNFPSSISTSGNDGASGIAPFANSMRSASGFHSNPLTSNYFQQNQNSGSGLLSSGNLQSRAAGIAACLSSASVSSSFPNKLHSEY